MRRFVAFVVAAGAVVATALAPAQAAPLAAPVPIVVEHQIPSVSPNPCDLTACSGGGQDYQYSGDRQTFNASGVEGYSVVTKVTNPVIHNKDDHSLSEITAQNSNTVGGTASRNIIEVGFTTGGGSFSRTKPTLFASAWYATSGSTSGTWLGWNGSFTDNPSCAHNLGDDLSGDVGTNITLAITYIAANGWWVYYGVAGSGGCWVGFFDKSIWTSRSLTFVTMTNAQLFNESVSAINNDLSCAQQGTAVNPHTTLASAQQWYNYTLLNATNGNSVGLGSSLETTPARWGSVNISTTAFASGGPGNTSLPAPLC